MSEAAGFLAALWHSPRDANEHYELRAFAPNLDTHRSFHGTAESLIRAATPLHDKRDVYMGVNPRVDRTGRKDGVRHVVAIFGEFDCPRELQANPTARDAWKVAKAAELEAHAYPPGLLTDSGGGLHGYWPLTTPLLLPPAGDRYRDAKVERVEVVLKALIQRLGASRESAEIGRILRLPGTFNHKPDYPDGPLLVRLLALHPERRYAFEELEAALLPVEIPSGSPAQTPRPALPPPARAKLRAATGLIAAYWPDKDAGATRHADIVLPLAGYLSQFMEPDDVVTVIEAGIRQAGDEAFLRERRQELVSAARTSSASIERNGKRVGLPTLKQRFPDLARLLGEVWSMRPGNIGVYGDCGAPDVAWEPPLPFSVVAVPPFPTEVLPSWLREWTLAEAEATQTPPDLAGLMALAALAAACARKVEMAVRDGFREPLNLYTVVSLPPATRKSAVFSDVTAPLEHFEQQCAESDGPKIAEAQATYKIAEKALARAQEVAAKAESATERERLTAEAADLARQLAALPPAVPTRLLVDDCTPERLATLLRDQQGRIAAMSPEGDLFEIMAGRYSDQANLGVFLKGHAGDTLRVDRVNRPPEQVRRPALTIGLAVQPDVIQGLAAKPGFRGRGLLARFAYALPESLVGRRNTRAAPMPRPVRDTYHHALLNLLEMESATDETGAPTPHLLTLSPEAAMLLEEFEAETEPRLSEFGDLGSMADWGGKLVGLVVRLAGLLYLARQARELRVPAGGPRWRALDAPAIQAAITLGHYLTEHARAAFAEMGLDPQVEAARSLLRWVEHHGKNSFTKRELQQNVKGRFRRVEELDPPLELLIRHGYLRLQESEPSGERGRPAGATYDVNPALLRHNPQNPQKGRAADPVEPPVGMAHGRPAAPAEVVHERESVSLAAPDDAGETSIVGPPIADVDAYCVTCQRPWTDAELAAMRCLVCPPPVGPAS